MSNHAEPRENDIEIGGEPAQAPDHTVVGAVPTGTYQSDATAHRRPEDHGYWDGDTFVFHHPIEMGGNIIKRLQTAGMVLEPGITRDDVVHALLNQTAGPIPQED